MHNSIQQNRQRFCSLLLQHIHRLPALLYLKVGMSRLR